MALQLVLSFAHVHPLPSSVTVISAPADAAGGSDLPLADGDCAICANIAAFASLDLPQQAAFLVPATSAEIIIPAIAATDYRAAPVRHFSSRAPPAA